MAHGSFLFSQHTVGLRVAQNRDNFRTTQSKAMRQPTVKKFCRVIRWIGAVALLAGGYSVYQVGFLNAFTINTLANRRAFLFLVENPALLAS
jgi:hypothetical protein